MTTTAKPDKPPGKLRAAPCRQRHGARGPVRGGGLMLPLLVVAVALVAAGIGAIIISGSFDTPYKATRARAEPRDQRRRRATRPTSARTTRRRSCATRSTQRNLAVANRDRLAGVLVRAARLLRRRRALDADGDPGADGRGAEVLRARTSRSPPTARCTSRYVTLQGRANAPNAVWLQPLDRRRQDAQPTPSRRRSAARAFQVRLDRRPATAEAHLPDLAARPTSSGSTRFSNTGNPIMADPLRRRRRQLDGRPPA